LIVACFIGCYFCIGARSELNVILQAWQNNDFSLIPPITILTPQQLNGANGAFSTQTNKIYLSSALFVDGNVEAIAYLKIYKD
jgi:hypothetical protein